MMANWERLWRLLRGEVFFPIKIKECFLLKRHNFIHKFTLHTRSLWMRMFFLNILPEKGKYDKWKLMLILEREMPSWKTRVNKASSSVRILNAQSLSIQDEFLYPLRVNYLYNKQGNYCLFCKLSQRKADYPGLGDWTNSERKYGY